MKVDCWKSIFNRKINLLAIDINDDTSTMSSELLNTVFEKIYAVDSEFFIETELQEESFAKLEEGRIMIYDGEKLVNYLLEEYLSKDYADILKVIYGKYDGKTHTLTDCSKMFGVSQSRIGQKRNKALTMMGNCLLSKKSIAEVKRLYSNNCICENMLQPEEVERRRILYDTIYEMSRDEVIKQESRIIKSPELKQMCMELSDIEEKAINRAQERIEKEKIEEERMSNDVKKISNIYRLPIEEISLSCNNRLKRANINYVKDLIDKRDELPKIRGVRKQSN